MSDDSLQLRRGDTWTLDLYVEDTPPLAGGAASPFDLSGCRIDLAVAKSDKTAPEFEQAYEVPASSTAVAGLARLLVLPNVTSLLRPRNYILHARVVRPSVVDFIATATYLRLKVLPSLFDEDQL